MHNKSLYIIGNGFDLHHGMKTSYWDFRDYLETADKELLDAIETYLISDELWSDFEEALVALDIDSIIDTASSFLVPYSYEDWSDSYHHDYQYEIQQIIELLSYKLKKAFEAWIKEVEVPAKSQIPDKILPLEKDALYLSFNYTPTIEKLYGVPLNKITFIHGSVAHGDKNLFLGHGWNPKDNSPMIDEKYPEDMDTRVLEGNDLINKYFSETYKPTDQVITNHRSFFESLDSIQNIYIFGHSLAKVDMPYFEAIVKYINHEKVQWTISYRSDSSRGKYQQAMKLLGVKPSKLTFIKLDDLLNGVL